MDHFEIVTETSAAQVPVRGRQYLAGSESEHVPVSIPMANDMILTLRANEPPSKADVVAERCRPIIDAKLYDIGGIHFRGLPLQSREDFSDFIKALGYQPCSYAGGIAVRKHEAGYALMASLEDSRITMAPHNESAYMPVYPRKAFFFCASEGTEGGEVPISDIRESIKLIPAEILAKFREKGIRYSRHLPKENREAEIGWVETFGTDDPARIAGIMAEQGYDFRWLDDGGLAYSYVNPAFVTHPDTGEELWFNQVTELHSSYWRNHPKFRSDLPEEAYPATTSYGDGTPIDPDLITFLRAVLWQTGRAVKLRKGEVLALDNLVVQHGRFAFAGPRQHMVSITQ